MDACYNSRWLDWDGDVRRSLLLIMENSKKPLKLTAGGFFTFSLGSFLAVSDFRVKSRITLFPFVGVEVVLLVFRCDAANVQGAEGQRIREVETYNAIFYCAYNNTSIYIYTFLSLEIFGQNLTTNIFKTVKQNNY